MIKTVVCDDLAVGENALLKITQNFNERHPNKETKWASVAAISDSSLTARVYILIDDNYIDGVQDAGVEILDKLPEEFIPSQEEEEE